MAVGCAATWVAVKARGFDEPDRQMLALWTWNVTSLGGKEPGLVWEVERYQLDLVGLTSVHSRVSGSLLPGDGLYSSLELTRV